MSLAGLLLFWLPHAVAPVQKEEVCPWCKNDSALLAAAGAVSHGPVPIGLRGSRDAAQTLPGPRPWIFLETAHLRWGMNLGSVAVEQKDRKRVEAELARLRKALPAVPAKIDKLDPFLRLHLMAMKGEEFYARFQKMLGVADADFPETRDFSKPYNGIGRFLGEKEKFEILLHADRRTHQRFTDAQMGVQITDALRWHYPEQHKMIASIPAADGDLRDDRGLFPHVVHNLSHLLLCAYRHFSYDPPVWLDEGLAHAMEREINPEAATFDGDDRPRAVLGLDRARPQDRRRRTRGLARRALAQEDLRAALAGGSRHRLVEGALPPRRETRGVREAPCRGKGSARREGDSDRARHHGAPAGAFQGSLRLDARPVRRRLARLGREALEKRLRESFSGK